MLWYCSNCGLSFDCRRLRDQHIYYIHRENTTTNSQLSSNASFRNSVNSRPFQVPELLRYSGVICLWCDKVFPTHNLYVEHIAEHNREDE